MIWINANKSKLYKLAAEHISLPRMKDTNFIETPCRTCYYLEWSIGHKVNYRACYTIIDRLPVLIIQSKKMRKNSRYKNISEYKLDYEELANKGMTKIIKRQSKIKAVFFSQQFLAANKD